MSEERRLAVLRAIVQDYVQTSEPVGSKALLERHALGVSAATVRNVSKPRGLRSARFPIGVATTYKTPAAGAEDIGNNSLGFAPGG